MSSPLPRTCRPRRRRRQRRWRARRVGMRPHAGSRDKRRGNGLAQLLPHGAFLDAHRLGTQVGIGDGVVRCRAVFQVVANRTVADEHIMVAGVVRAPGRLASGRQMHGQDMGQRGAKVLTLDDGVDQAMFERELGGLEPFGQLLANGVADNALPGEADERFGLGQDDVAVHSERRGDAAGGGIGDDRDVRQMRRGMALDARTRSSPSA